MLNKSTAHSMHLAPCTHSVAGLLQPSLDALRCESVRERALVLESKIVCGKQRN